MSNTTINKPGWLLFFYSVPSKPPGNRVKIWRKLAGAGAVQLKGSVYVLPDSEEHYELYQWLTGEVEHMQGEAAFVRVPAIETMSDEELVDVFSSRAAERYRTVEKELDTLEARLAGDQVVSPRQLVAGIARLERDFGRLAGVDFFDSPAGRSLKERLAAARSAVDRTAGPAAGRQAPAVAIRRKEDYRGRRWVTRPRPSVDRMASAWLIRRFIDGEAVFDFVPEKQLGRQPESTVSFDVRGGEFTHVGELCTFEVLVSAFGLKARPLKVIAELVHELDLRDGRYSHAESAGIGAVLQGIRDSAAGDAEALQKGMDVFEALYSSVKNR